MIYITVLFLSITKENNIIYQVFVSYNTLRNTNTENFLRHVAWGPFVTDTSIRGGL